MKSRTPSSSRLDPKPREPAYQQLARMLAQQIISGRSAAGSLLPEERELAQIHKVSRCTVRRALDVLQDQGLIQRIRRRGTVVAGEPSGRRWFSTAGSILAVFIGQASGQSQPTDPYLASMYGGIRQMARKLGLPVRTEGLRSYARVSLDEYRPPKALRGRRRDRLRCLRRAVHPHVRLGGCPGGRARLLDALRPGRSAVPARITWLRRKRVHPWNWLLPARAW